MAHEMIQAQKKQFAKDILIHLADLKKKIEVDRYEIDQINSAINQTSLSNSLAGKLRMIDNRIESRLDNRRADRIPLGG